MSQSTTIVPGDTIAVEPKNPLTSVTVIGVIVFTVASLLKKYGYKISDELLNDTVQAILTIFQLIVGPIVAIIGRWRATRPLGIGSTTKAVTVKLLPFAFVLILMPGCAALKGIVTPGYSRAEHDAWREGVYKGVKEEVQENQEWARAVAKQPGAIPLPDLSALTDDERAVWLRARERNGNELLRAFENDRARSSSPVTTAPVTN